jgi:hypothetical protein
LSYNMCGSSKGGWRRTGPLEPPNHAKQPSLTHSTFPSLPTSLSPSHGWPSSPHMVLLLKLKAIKGFVAPPQDLATRTGPFFPTLAHLVSNLGPFLSNFDPHFLFDYYRKKQAILPPPLSLSLSLSLYIYIYLFSILLLFFSPPLSDLMC